MEIICIFPEYLENVDSKIKEWNISTFLQEGGNFFLHLKYSVM